MVDIIRPSQQIAVEAALTALLPPGQIALLDRSPLLVAEPPTMQERADRG